MKEFKLTAEELKVREAAPQLLKALQSILLNGHSEKSVIKAEEAINKALN